MVEHPYNLNIGRGRGQEDPWANWSTSLVGETQTPRGDFVSRNKIDES